MSFRDKMASTKQDLSKRHKEAATKEGQRNYGSIFIPEKIPQGRGFWSPAMGDNLIDVIPFFAGTQHPHVPKDVLHFVVRLFVYTQSCPNGVPYVSPGDNFDEPDPIRDYMNVAGRLPTEEFKKVASKDRCAFLVWVHTNPEEEAKGIQIWEASFEWSYKKIAEISELPMGGGHIPFSDPDKGKRIFFKMVKSGKYIDSRGVERDGREVTHWSFVDRLKPIPEYILDQTWPLDESIKMHVPYGELYQAFWGKPYVEGEPAPTSRTLQHPAPAPAATSETSQTGVTETTTPVVAAPAVSPVQNETDVITNPAPATATPAITRPVIRRGAQETPAPAAEAPPAPAATYTPGVCQYGHNFGYDVEKKPECNGCVQWSACSEAEDKRLASTAAPAPAAAPQPTVAAAPQPAAVPSPAVAAAAATPRRPIIRRKA